LLAAIEILEKAQIQKDKSFTYIEKKMKDFGENFQYMENIIKNIL
jgi:hypothetical protein